jgi:hypothetical protein
MIKNHNITDIEVLETLHACSFAPSAEEQQTATEHLQYVSQNPGSITLICNAFNVANDTSTRLLAVIMLKMIVQRSIITQVTLFEDEQYSLIQFVFNNLGLPIDQKISTQLSALLAKLARIYYPSRIPDLFPYLLSRSLSPPQQQQQQQQHLSRRIHPILSMIEVYEELDLITQLERPDKELQSNSIQIFPTLVSYWIDVSKSLVANVSTYGSTGFTELATDMELDSSLMLLIRIVAKKSNMQHLNKDVLGALFNQIFIHLKLTISLCSGSNSGSNGGDYSAGYFAMEKTIDEIVLLILDAQTESPVEMAEFVPLFHSIFINELQLYCNTHYFREPPQYLINAVLLISSALSSEDFTSISELDTYFSQAMIENLLQMSVLRLLHYPICEQEEWVDDPEQFYMAMQAQYVGDNMRTATERLIIDLWDSPKYTEFMMPFLLSMMQNSEAQFSLLRPDCEESDLLSWDAIYTCIGLGAWQVGLACDFTSFFHSMLIPIWLQLLNNPQAGTLKKGQQVLRRRLLWLMRCCFFLFEPVCHGEIFNLAMNIMEPQYGSDLNAYIEACFLIETGVDAGAFTMEMLTPSLVNLVSRFAFLCTNLEEPEVLVTVVAVIDKVIQCAGMNISSVLPDLGKVYWSMWNNTTSTSPVRSVLIESIDNLVCIAGTPSAVLLSDLIIPLIALSCSGNTENSHLVASGISLWLSVMRNICHTEFQSEVNDLFKHVFTNLFPTYSDATLLHTNANTDLTAIDNTDISGENQDRIDSILSLHETKEILLICEVYATYGGHQWLEENATILHFIYQKHLCQVNPQMSGHLIRVLMSLCLVCPMQAGLFIQQSGLLKAPLRACCAASMIWGDRDTGIFCAYKEADITVVNYLALISQLLLIDAQYIVLENCAEISTEVSIDCRNKSGLNTNTLFSSLCILILEKVDHTRYSPGGVYYYKILIAALLQIYRNESLLITRKVEIENAVNELKNLDDNSEIEDILCLLTKDFDVENVEESAFVKHSLTLILADVKKLDSKMLT